MTSLLQQEEVLGNYLPDEHPLADEDDFLSLKIVQAKCRLKRAEIYKRMSEGRFPKQIALGPNCVGWRRGDINAWQRAMIQQAQPSAR